MGDITTIAFRAKRKRTGRDIPGRVGFEGLVALRFVTVTSSWAGAARRRSRGRGGDTSGRSARERGDADKVALSAR